MDQNMDKNMQGSGNACHCWLCNGNCCGNCGCRHGGSGVCTCGHGGWGGGHHWGWMILRIVLLLVIASVVFGIGVKIGELKATFGGVNGWNDYGYPGGMMAPGGYNMMYRGGYNMMYPYGYYPPVSAQGGASVPTPAATPTK